MCTQTNDDNLEEETQTEAIESSNKWTQFPIACRQKLTTSEDIKLFRKVSIIYSFKHNMRKLILNRLYYRFFLITKKTFFFKEQIGVGSDEDDVDLTVVPAYDILQLNEFLERAGKVMLCLLEERRFGGNILQKDNHDMPFSGGCVKLLVNSLTFLSGRSVTSIVYSEVLNKVLLTIHAPGDEVHLILKHSGIFIFIIIL